MGDDDITTETLTGEFVKNGHGGHPHAIARISIEGLFGQYNYDLPSAKRGDDDLSRLFILYGENGTGKTTLLKLIYHALSPEDNQGHRSFLSQTRFDRFAIELVDGTVLEITRKVKAKGGTMLLALHRDARTIENVEIELNDAFGVTLSDKSKQAERLKDFLIQLGKLRIKLYYLSDDRRHQGELSTRNGRTKLSDPFQRAVLTRVVRESHIVVHDESGITEESDDDRSNSLQSVMGRVTAWVQQQVRKGATRGQGSAYSIYSKVISDIAHSLDIRENGDKAEVERLVNELHQLEKVSGLYAEYGLTLPFPANELINSIQVATSQTLPVVCRVIRPHIDGVQARLRALTDIYDTIHRFIETINSFYRNKKIGFTVDKGFTVTAGREPLHPDWLSSGERQLLLLLCNTVLARKHASLFLIDEPELSLNVKWQRQLIQAILDNAVDSHVQFFLATHSVELVTQHRSNVVRLNSKPSRGAKASSREGQNGGEA